MAGAEQYDVLFTGGTVIDGTGAARQRADVAVSGDRIAAVVWAIWRIRRRPRAPSTRPGASSRPASSTPTPTTTTCCWSTGT